MMLRMVLLNAVTFSWLLYVSNGFYSKLCPASSHLNFTANKDHLYPVEIYHRGQLSTPVHTCSVKEHDKHKIYSCPDSSVDCPIIADNVKEGLRASQEWPKSTSLCRLKVALHDPNRSAKVLVFGGSVPFGVDADGCCEGAECAVLVEFVNSKRCAWPHYIERWMQYSFEGKSTLFNLAYGGTTSQVSGECVGSYLSQAGVSDLSGEDLVLVDHSVNDATMCNYGDKQTVAVGLETLIRRLISSARRFTLGDFPTIVLMDMETRRSDRSPFAGQTSTCYMATYQSLARHYGLRIYSYADAVLHNSSSCNDYQQLLHHHLTHKHRREAHPPWHTHLVYADFLSSLLLAEMETCSSSTASSAAAVVPYVMPEPLNKVNDTAHCSPQHSPYLRISYDDIQANTTLGSFAVPVQNTWQVRRDRKRRGGIIAELDTHTNFSLAHMAPVVFSLNLTVQELLRDERVEFVLQMIYLRSYSNAARVALYLCDTEIVEPEEVDALWRDYRHFRYSTQAVFTWTLDKDYCRHLLNPNKEAPVTFTVRHNLWSEGYDIRNMSSVLEKQPRGSQMFKIVSLSVCRY